MTRRRLTAEERALWRKLTDQVERFEGRKPEPEEPPAPAPKPKSHKSFPRQSSRPELGLGDANRYHAPENSPGVRMDRKKHLRMRRGKLKPEAKIDLHGMTLDRAHPALTRFILSAQGSGKRLVLVITGKGRPDSGDSPFAPARGILRRQVPQWLQLPPLNQAVLQVDEAHISHGGGGAFYVYLRKLR